MPIAESERRPLFETSSVEGIRRARGRQVGGLRPAPGPAAASPAASTQAAPFTLGGAGARADMGPAAAPLEADDGPGRVAGEHPHRRAPFRRRGRGVAWDGGAGTTGAAALGVGAGVTVATGARAGRDRSRGHDDRRGRGRDGGLGHDDRRGSGSGSGRGSRRRSGSRRGSEGGSGRDGGGGDRRGLDRRLRLHRRRGGRGAPRHRPRGLMRTARRPAVGPLERRGGQAGRRGGRGRVRRRRLRVVHHVGEPGDHGGGAGQRPPRLRGPRRRGRLLRLRGGPRTRVPRGAARSARPGRGSLPRGPGAARSAPRRRPRIPGSARRAATRSRSLVLAPPRGRRLREPLLYLAGAHLARAGGE